MGRIESANKEFNYPRRYSQEYQNVELNYETLFHPQSKYVSVDIVRDEHENQHVDEYEYQAVNLH